MNQDRDNAPMFKGYVHFVNVDNIVADFHRHIHSIANHKCHVRFTFCRTPLKLMHRALDDSVPLLKKLFANQNPGPQPWYLMMIEYYYVMWCELM